MKTMNWTRGLVVGGITLLALALGANLLSPLLWGRADCWGYNGCGWGGSGMMAFNPFGWSGMILMWLLPVGLFVVLVAGGV